MKLNKYINDKYKNYSRDDLIQEIERLKDFKKYGLVWENRNEDVLDRCKSELPVLEEVKEKSIISDPNKPINLLIEGDNYHSLSVLNYTHKNAIDIIYIDPPYNTGNKDFVYNDVYVDPEDAYRHSKWISFMYNRLRLTKKLLKKDGSLFVSIDDHEYPRLIMLLESIFGKNKIKTICVKMSEATGVKMASVIKNGRIPKLKEYLIIVKQDGINNLYLEKLPKEQWDDEYKTIITNTSEEEINQIKTIRDSENRTEEEIVLLNKIIKNWKYTSLSEYFKNNHIPKREQQNYKYQNAWRIFRTVATTSNVKKIADEIRKSNSDPFFCVVTPRNKLYIIINNYDQEQAQPRIKILFADDYLTQHPGDFWADIKTTGLENEGGINFRNGKKPLKLIERIIKTNKRKNTTILDFFAGSGTTGEAVLRVNNEDGGTRKFILCTYNEENGNGKVIDDYCYPRLKNVFNGYGSKPPIAGNIKYYRTSFVPAEATDRNKTLLTKKVTEMLCIKENTFDNVINKSEYKVYKNIYNNYTGVLFDQLALPLFKEEIKKIGAKISIYIFSLSDDTFESEFEDMSEKVKLTPIPESILRVYRNIF